MKIAAPCAVTLSWTLRDTLGETLDECTEPVEFLVGGRDLLARIEQALEGHGTGDQIELHLEPEDAFGDFDEQALFLEPRHCFPESIETGMVFEELPAGCSEAARQHPLCFVDDIYPDHVVLNGNHPLAGIALRLNLQVQGVRSVSEEEAQRGTLGSGFFRLVD